MYFRNLIILATLSAALSLTNEAFATGNVLLPQDNSAPNLGLVPVEPTPASPESTLDKKPELAAPAEPTTLPPAPSSAVPPSATTTPSSVQPPAFQAPKPTPAQAAAMNPELYKNYMPAPEPLPYTITVSLAKPALSNNDLEQVSTQLGLAKSEIANQCRFGINGILISDRGSYNVDSHMTTTVDVPYNGALNNAMLSVYSVCDSAPKPPQYSFMQKMGNKFSIAVGVAFCSPAKPFAGTLRHIVITHSGTGNDTCVYQQ